MSVNGHYLAAAIAFYSFLSIFPAFPLRLITLWRFVVGIEGFEDRLITGIVTQIPVLAETEGPSFVEGFIHNVSNDPAVTSSLTGLGLFIAGMGVFGSIRKSVNVIWGNSSTQTFPDRASDRFHHDDGRFVTSVFGCFAVCYLLIYRRDHGVAGHGGGTFRSVVLFGSRLDYPLRDNLRRVYGHILVASKHEGTLAGDIRGCTAHYGGVRDSQVRLHFLPA